MLFDAVTVFVPVLILSPTAFKDIEVTRFSVIYVREFVRFTSWHYRDSWWHFDLSYNTRLLSQTLEVRSDHNPNCCVYIVVHVSLNYILIHSDREEHNVKIKPYKICILRLSFDYRA